MILNKYRINENTFALLPALEINFDTIVIEKDQQLNVRQTGLDIIKKACFDDWTTYDGRRNAATYHTTFKRKVPILVNMITENYFFPTHSPTSIYNKWFSYQHIASIKESTIHPTKTIITFSNGTEICVNVSPHIVDKQMQRTFECIYRMRRGREEEEKLRKIF